MAGIRPYPERQRRGPLKKIVKILRRSSSKFDQGVAVLECGHQVRTNSTNRARCDRCPAIEE